jgi:fatty-acid peroxygenase
MHRIPREPGFDHTLALRADPYRFIAKRCRIHGSDVFEARILLQKTLCMTGPEAARLFYDEERFMRAGAAPGRLVKTLFGKSGVQTLDEASHRHRKRMFLDILALEPVSQLAETTADVWAACARQWRHGDQVVLYEAMQGVLMRAVCAWAGIPLDESEVQLRTRQVAALFSYAGSVGLMHGYARNARRGSEVWLADLVERIRSSEWKLAESSAAHVIAWHRDPRGALLDPRTAAVELLNVLRPTVAVAVWIAFVAHALHEHPECRAEIERDKDGYVDRFVQEVRRFYPFFPAVVARTRREFEWKGYTFPRGRRALLDLWGTDHDARIWQRPNEFDPERFVRRPPNAFAFIPQGGGDPASGHRCPGEEVAVEIMKLAARFLVHRLQYEAPPQDLELDMTNLPALPRSGFVMRNVRLHD